MSTLTIETSRFGPIEVEAKNVIRFISPILGFEQVSEYVLLDHAENSPFKWLQAVTRPELAFVITNPKYFGIAYEFSLPDDAVDKLGVEKAEDVMVFTIVNIPQDNPSLMTANLMAPLVLHQESLEGMQVVLHDNQFTTRVRLLGEGTDAAETKTMSTQKGDR